jgi:hypothetical protein
MNLKFIRGMLKVSKSIYGYVLVINKRAQGVRQLKEIGVYKTVHVVCPGPTASNIKNAEIDKDDAVIFVNFAVKLSPEVLSGNLFFLSADIVRYKEVLESFTLPANIKNRILLLASTFRLGSDNTWRKSDVLIVPHYRFKWPIGLSAKISSLDKLSKETLGCEQTGFGTLNYALQVAAHMGEREIKLYGCDFGKVKGMLYGVENIPIRNDTPYDVIKFDFDRLVKHLETKLNRVISISDSVK